MKKSKKRPGQRGHNPGHNIRNQKQNKTQRKTRPRRLDSSISHADWLVRMESAYGY
jgi:hypothetical protein